MTGPADSNPRAAGDWEAYWAGAREVVAGRQGGPQDVVLERFWTRLFRTAIPALPRQPRILDIGCGNGAVAGFALHVATAAGAAASLELVGFDRSHAALTENRKRYPQVSCVAGDAVRPPFPASSFDLVTSQFGVEYGGSEALAAAAHLVADGGVLALVLHQREGGIYRECAVNRAAIDGFLQSGLLPGFTGIFQSAEAVQQGRGSAADFQAADRRFAAVVRTAEGVLARYGKQVADGKLFQVYSDVAHMYREFRNYEPGEVYDWIGVMTAELDSYAGRMTSMLEAALDDGQFAGLRSSLTDAGFTIRISDTLGMGPDSVPAAWVLAADKVGA